MTTNAKQAFRREYRHLRTNLRRGANRASWLNGFTDRGGHSRAAAYAVRHNPHQPEIDAEVAAVEAIEQELS